MSFHVFLSILNIIKIIDKKFLFFSFGCYNYLFILNQVTRHVQDNLTLNAQYYARKPQNWTYPLAV